MPYGEAVQEDWAVVSRSITERMLDLGMTQTELAAKAQVSLTTVRELVHNLNARRRNPRTLGALSLALDWPEDAIQRLLRGGQPTGARIEPADPVVEELRELREQLVAMQQQIDSLSQQVTTAPPPSELEDIREALAEITARLPETEKL